MKKLSRLIKNLESDPDIAKKMAEKTVISDEDEKRIKDLQARCFRIIKCARLRYEHQTEESH